MKRNRGRLTSKLLPYMSALAATSILLNGCAAYVLLGGGETEGTQFVSRDGSLYYCQSKPQHDAGQQVTARRVKCTELAK